ncbi:hypothetical protein ACDQ55_21315 [Chitinophaga sp. 30R24]|uniref:hypothetical protein n=1 Tax=Chitinophaga sp. 30R24 TaxID=3248838 RepID=UPI003B91B993
MRIIISVFYFLIFTSCIRGYQKKVDLSPILSKDSVFYLNIRKDSAYLINYDLQRATTKNNRFTYTSHRDTFTIVYDSQFSKWTGIFGGDSIKLILEKEHIYEINGTNYKIYKLIRDPGIADGEMSYFVNLKIGVLAIKSNTWRSYQILKKIQEPDMEIVLSSLLFNIVNDEIFWNNQNVTSDIKFVAPTK